MEKADAEKYIELFRTMGRLKKTPRAGWGMRGVTGAESVAEHSHRMSLMALALGRELGADPFRLAAMCAMHDIAESLVGDITPVDGISPEKKRALEEAAVRKMFSGAPGGDGHIAMWLEYEEGATAEAVAARLLDKLEMALQAVEYGEEFPELDLSEFIESASAVIDGTKLEILLKVFSRNSCAANPD